MPSTLELGELTLTCRSRAGDQTWLKVQPPGIAFDVGRGTPRLAGVGRIFLTHGHLDHALGLPFLLSVRRQVDGAPLQVVCPRAIESALGELVRAAERLDGREYEFEIRGVEAGERVEVGRDLEIEPFSTEHGVASLGYHLVRRRHRLRRDLVGAPQRELERLSRRGEELNESYEELWLSVTGDTSAQVFDLEPRLYESGILVVECTFMASGHEARARRFHHLHLADLVERRDRFANRALVLYHLSRRHRSVELETTA
ncbi:MAG: MBL fold metallo-hydrolase, partial [Thermoanaerobaculia bacterium]|nr:MBL fold metallo-hydrolase [Thermoanaerobaculia bacterium]